MNGSRPASRLLRPLSLAASLSIGVSSAFAADVAPTPEQLQFFENKVRPVLVEHCYSCHSTEAKKLKAHLFVDSRDGLLKGGDTGPSITPGDPEKSLFIEAITYKNVDLQMPPKTKLSDAQIADLTAWVKMGAPWPKEAKVGGKLPDFDIEKRKAASWAFQPVKPQAVPAVQKKDWVRTPIDAFILAKLEAKKISPAPAADPRTLIRRLYFDLIGLPPTAEEVESFVKEWEAEKGIASSNPKSEIPNPKSSAISALVDRLLASPHFGEKWARHWMDLARFAETCGHEFEYPIPHAWRYRDYLIRAFNDDVPYNQFVTEHIAGDLLKNPRIHPTQGTNESIVATGFWFLHEATHAPVDVRLDGAIRVDNQVDVFSKTFLGLTVACARCHDHKFDPISTKDFYALSGFIRSSRRQEALLDPHGKIATGAKQIVEERNKGDAALVASLPKIEDRGAADRLTEEYTKYLLATYEVINGVAKPSEASAKPKEDILFDDFESGTYANWTAEGKAFGDKPQTQQTIGSYQGDVGAKGKWFVNSHNIREGGDTAKGDSLTGTLTSKAFTIDRDFITFLIDGGAHADKTCLNLIIDGKVARSVTGKNENRMSAASMNVRDLRGKKAQLKLVDDHTGGWGNIGLDHVVFTDLAPGDTNAKPGRAADEVAKERGLDAGMLARWVKAVQIEDVKSIGHPMYLWRRAVDAKAADAKTLASVSEAVRNEAEKLTQKFAGAKKDGPTLDFAGWTATGEAFGSLPTKPAEWDPGSPTPRAVEPGIAHSGLISPKLRGVLRSPTFTIPSDKIHYRIKGSAQVRLIIDGYVMDIYSGLLFSDIQFRIDTKGKWQWRTQGGDLNKYVGHRAHIEVIDDGDGEVAIDEVRFGSAPTDPWPARQTGMSGDEPRQPPASLALLAQDRAQAIVATLADWKDGTLAVDDASLANWAIEHQLPWRDEIKRQELESTLIAHAKRMSEIAATLPQPVKAQALADGTGEDEYIMIRGSHKNLGPPAPRQLLEAIAGNQPAIKEGSGRLELARRVTDPSNPFISRVIVNRLWHHLYGRGIVPTVDDFGFMGLPPSHPELLDWLADDFIKHGWSMKRAIKQMVMSNVYQQSSRIESDGDAAAIEAADPTNQLLHRFPIRRLQAEAIRDAMLTVSGRLDRTVGGPSVPVHLTPFMDGRGKPGSSGPLDGNGRRSLYTEIRRNFLPPMMLAFDYPNPFSTMGRRTVSNVPAQALILMNDPFVIEQAKRWATRVLDGKGTVDERITRMFDAALTRPPTKPELEAMRGFIAEQARLYNAKEDDLRVWTDAAHVVFNMKAFVFVE